MSDGPDWQPTFDIVGQVPEEGFERLTEKDISDKWSRINKGNAANIAVGLGGVDTGDDFDPWGWLSDYAQGIADDFQNTWDAVVQAFTGDSQTGWTIFDMFGAAAGQRAELTQIAAGLAQMQSDLAANNNSGSTFTVAMADSGTSMPTELTKFEDTGAGSVTNDGDTLEFSNDDGREMFGYNVSALQTDYCEVSLVVPRQAGTYFGSYGNRAVYFVGRANAAFTTYCFARLNGNKIRVGCVEDGVTTLSSPTWFGSEQTVSPASYMTFRCGSVGGDDVFQFLVNNQVRATFTDGGGGSLIGSAYHWFGFGIENDANDLVNRVPNVSHLVANDNEPAPVLGSGATLVRTSTGSVGVTSGVNVLPDDFFDGVEEVSADMTYDLEDGSVTIPADDWYTVNVNAKTGSAWVDHFSWVLYRDSVAHKYFGPDYTYGSSGLGGTIIPDWLGATWTGYLTAGDVIQIGYNAPATIGSTLTGTADGAQTYFTIRRGR